MTVFYHSDVMRLFQGVAYAVLGKQALEGGMLTALVRRPHSLVRFGWSAVFCFLGMRSGWIRDLLDSRNVWQGRIAVRAVLWIVMSLAVIPFCFTAPPRSTFAGWCSVDRTFPSSDCRLWRQSQEPPVEKTSFRRIGPEHADDLQSPKKFAQPTASAVVLLSRMMDRARCEQHGARRLRDPPSLRDVASKSASQ